jgi:hypothetical protein
MFFQANVNRYFYSKVPCERDWSFVVRYDPRGRLVKYFVEEEDDIEEEDDAPKTEHDDWSTYGEYGEDEPGVGYNAILDDDVDKNMLENDIDDDDDIINPLYTIYEPDDDTYVKLHEEEDT